MNLYVTAQISQTASFLIGMYLEKPIIVIPAMFVMLLNMMFKDYLV